MYYKHPIYARDFDPTKKVVEACCLTVAEDKIQQLQSEKAELLEALGGLLWAIHFNDNFQPHPMPAMEAKAREVIAKHKGGEL